jgi:hypothetical protein
MITPIRAAIVGFGIVLLITWFCYRPALDGAFQLDDRANLSGLAAVDGFEAARDFVFSGTAGPTGRPIALLTFALQADEWEYGPRAFIRINVLIHLLNAVLLAACFYQLTLLQAVERSRAAIIAMVAASCWVVMPLLASASLLVVQRMATLSASLALLGLLAYLLGRGRIETAPNRALLLMSGALVAGTALATLSKELGFLLPAYVLVLESTVLRKPDAVPGRLWRTWQAVFLVLPTVIVIGYLAARSSYPEWMVANRGFTGWERLLSESRILWAYLYKALFTLPSQLGIYQAPPIVSRSLLEPLVLLSAAAWTALAVAAITWRRRWPLFALAVLWFLAGHLMESTVLSLELYFEHRNYLPVAGVVYAAVAGLLLGPARWRLAATALVPLYLVVSALSLYGFASLSGDASASSRYWALQYPDSVRAVTTMATYQLDEEGPLKTLSTIDRFVIERPQFGYLRIQELNLRCMIMPDQDHDAVLEELRRELPGVEFTFSAGDMLSQLFSTVIATECNGVGFDTVAELARVLQQNPRYETAPRYNQFHHKLLAGIARQQGDYAATVDHLERAIGYLGSEELNMMMVTTLAGAGNFSAADEFINNAMLDKPVNPLRAFAWRQDLEELRTYIRELEKQ